MLPAVFKKKTVGHTLFQFITAVTTKIAVLRDVTL
jgi:hypothetical protein